MKKKLLALFAIVAFVAAPTFANTLTDKVSDMKTDASTTMSETNEKIFNNTTHPTWAAGLVLGTNLSIQVNYRVNPQLTVEGVVGLGFLNSNLLLEAYGMYNVYNFKINDETFRVNAGPGVTLGLFSGYSMSVLGAGEVAYSFDDDLPLDLALRLAMGVNLDFANSLKPSFVGSGSIACTYRFI
jgi:hypothetical protein